MVNDKNVLGYCKTFETEMVRIKHRITSKLEHTALNLKEMLNDVPSNATIDDIDIDEETGIFYIEFHEERIK